MYVIPPSMTLRTYHLLAVWMEVKHLHSRSTCGFQLDILARYFIALFAHLWIYLVISWLVTLVVLSDA